VGENTVMQRKLVPATILGAIGLIWATGCGQTVYDDALPPTLEQVDEIRDSGTLEPQEKREALAAFGLDPVTINGLLQGETLANQFGGTLSTAYAKVSHELNAEDQQPYGWSDLTPDEVQYYGDATDVTTYADVEAQAIVDFFNDENVDTVEDLEAFLEDPATELPAEIDEVNLEEVFINTSLSYVRDKLP
jgi:hypothetical protein